MYVQSFFSFIYFLTKQQQQTTMVHSPSNDATTTTIPKDASNKPNNSDNMMPIVLEATWEKGVVTCPEWPSLVCHAPPEICLKNNNNEPNVFTYGPFLASAWFAECHKPDSVEPIRVTSKTTA